MRFSQVYIPFFNRLFCLNCSFLAQYSLNVREIPKISRTFVLCISLLFSSSLFSQNLDSLFKVAQGFANSGKYDTAITLLTQICDKQTNNLDARLYRARVSAWKKDFDFAESESRYILSKQPQNKEAFMLLSDIFLWSKQWGNLENLTQNALKTLSKSAVQQEGLSDSIIFIKKYAYGLIEQKRFNEAEKALYPLREYLYSLWESVKSKTMLRSISAHQSYYAFKGNQKDWTVTELEYSQKLKPFTYILSFNRANRFGKSGNQGMIQVYPKIGSRAYAWLLAGFSDGKTYPNSVYGGNFYFYPTKPLEVEVGMRVFKVTDLEKTIILRGGLVYQKKAHRMGYNIMQVRGVSANGLAHTIFYQNYFDKHESYWKLGIGTGSSASALLTPQFDNFIINSLSISGSSLYYLHRKWRLLGNITLEQSKNQATNAAQSRWVFGLGLVYKF